MTLRFFILVLLCFNIKAFAFDSDKMTESEWGSSLIFTDNQFKALKDAIIFYQENFLKSTPHEEQIGEGEAVVEQKPLPQKQFSPTFFMNSIIYESPKKWTLWLNDIKFTSKVAIQIEGIEELKPMEVKATYVKFSMIVKDINKLSPLWNNKLKVRGKGIFESNDKAIHYNIDEDKIIFKLSPNQTFVLYDMEIEEGRKPFTPIVVTEVKNDQ